MVRHSAVARGSSNTAEGRSLPYMVFLLEKSLAPKAAASFFQTLRDDYNVKNMKIASTLELCRSTAQEVSSEKNFIVCSAEAGHNQVVEALEGHPIPNLKGILLLCGPHEDFYGSWAVRHPIVTFLTHNIKELRRAVVWLAAGGTFNSVGDACAPPVCAEQPPNRPAIKPVVAKPALTRKQVFTANVPFNSRPNVGPLLSSIQSSPTRVNTSYVDESEDTGAEMLNTIFPNSTGGSGVNRRIDSKPPTNPTLLMQAILEAAAKSSSQKQPTSGMQTATGSSANTSGRSSLTAAGNAAPESDFFANDFWTGDNNADTADLLNEKDALAQFVALLGALKLDAPCE